MLLVVVWMVSGRADFQVNVAPDCVVAEVYRLLVRIETKRQEYALNGSQRDGIDSQVAIRLYHDCSSSAIAFQLVEVQLARFEGCHRVVRLKSKVAS